MFDMAYVKMYGARPSQWPHNTNHIEDMICTPEQAKAKREFADKFKQFDFDWHKMPQEKEVNDQEH